MNLIKEELHKLYGDKVKIKSFTLYPKGIRIEEGRVELRIRKGYPEGSAVVRSDGKSVRVRLKLLWKRTVPVAAFDISKGEVLSTDKIEWKEIYLEKVIPDILGRDEFVEDYIALRDISAGELIRKRFLRKRYIVRKGDMVRIIYRKGAIVVTYEAEALESGFRGSVIRLRVPSSGKIIKGRVIGENEVEIK